LQAATPGCTKQACKFRDDYAKFQGKAEVLGISSDTPEVNAEFAKARRSVLTHHWRPGLSSIYIARCSLGQHGCCGLHRHVRTAA